MDFWTYMGLIERSKPAEWLVAQYSDPDGHSEFLTFKPDMSMSIAMGLPHLRDFDEPWVKVFHDSNASSSWIDLRWNGLPILRVLGVHVDGARCMLPVPVPGRPTWEVPQAKSDFFELLDGIVGLGDYRRYFREVRMTINSDPWPEALKAR